MKRRVRKHLLSFFSLKGSALEQPSGNEGRKADHVTAGIRVRSGTANQYAGSSLLFGRLIVSLSLCSRRRTELGGVNIAKACLEYFSRVAIWFRVPHELWPRK